jgi:hypothetical protein
MGVGVWPLRGGSGFRVRGSGFLSTALPSAALRTGRTGRAGVFGVAVWCAHLRFGVAGLFWTRQAAGVVVAAFQTARFQIG